MSDFNLEGIEGLTDEQISAIQERGAALVAKRDEVLGETKETKAKLREQTEALESARKAAKDAEAKALEAQGKYEEAQKIREEERAKLVAEAEAERDAFKSQIEKRAEGELLESLLSDVIPEQKDFVRAYLQSLVQKEYNNGELNLSLSYEGENLTPSDFKSRAFESDMFKAVLRGANSSGAGTVVSKSVATTATGADGVKARLAARLAQKIVSN